jgi:hypothetical protein
MKFTILIFIAVAIGLLSSCSFLHEIDVDIDYSWNVIDNTLTINYTLTNSGEVALSDVVVTFGADLTTGGNNDYSDPEDLSIYTSPVDISRGSSDSDSVSINTGGLTVYGVGVTEIGMDNPPDDD